MTHKRENIHDIVIIPQRSEERLDQRQLMNYRTHRKKPIERMLHLGKDPDRAEGYAWDTVRHREFELGQLLCRV